MAIYSEQDKFSSGVAIMVFVPLMMPYFVTYRDTNIFYLIIPLVIFLAILISDIKILTSMIQKGGQPKKFSILVFITVVINIFLSLMLQDLKWLVFPASIWCVFLTLWSKRVYS